MNDLLSDPRVQRLPKWLYHRIKHLTEATEKLAYDLHLQQQETESESRWAKVYLDNYKDAQDILRQIQTTDGALKSRIAAHIR